MNKYKVTWVEMSFERDDDENIVFDYKDLVQPKAGPDECDWELHSVSASSSGMVPGCVVVWRQWEQPA